MFILAMWLTYASAGLEPIGDVFIEISTIILATRFVQLFKYDLKFSKCNMLVLSN